MNQEDGSGNVRLERPVRRHEAAEAFRITDIFLVNAAMGDAEPEHREAWKRVRSKLIEAANILPPTLSVPDDLLDENGDIIPGKVHDA